VKRGSGRKWGGRRKWLIAVTILLAALAGAGIFFAYAPSLPPPADLKGTLQNDSVRGADRTRMVQRYVPAALPSGAPLLIVLHGSTQDALAIRQFSGYEFERLADIHKFVVAYPNGYEGNWNDCRRAASYPARALDIDDTAFTIALVEQAMARHGINPARVYVIGYSNGGHLAFRLALEMPQRFAGLAAIAANLPTDDNSICRSTGVAVPFAIVNGTLDPINPYAGGRVTLFGFGNRGTVLSSPASAARFAGVFREAREKDVGVIGGAYPGVEQRAWEVGGEPRVVLYSVIGGGHVIPQPHYRAPRMLGRTVPEFNAPEALWRFFMRLPARSG
jgi:polyhydroxybutyrate depolymerase